MLNKAQNDPASFPYLSKVDNVFVPDCYGHGFLDNRGFSRVTIRKTSVTSALQGILQQAQVKLFV
jgi:hypothetical protein